jgi:hypothetical protein
VWWWWGQTSRDLRKHDGQDIICKGQRSAGKYLLQLPGFVDLSAMTAAGGTLGELADMHTANPTLYIEFAEGRIKLRGTVCSSGTGLLPVTFHEKHPAALTCKGDIRNIITFPEWFWIGCTESNPEEHPLPFPAAVRTVLVTVIRGAPHITTDWLRDRMCGVECFVSLNLAGLDSGSYHGPEQYQVCTGQPSRRRHRRGDGIPSSPIVDPTTATVPVHGTGFRAQVCRWW